MSAVLLVVVWEYIIDIVDRGVIATLGGPCVQPLVSEGK